MKHVDSPAQELRSAGPASSRFELRRVAGLLLFVALGGSALAAVAPFLSELFWALELPGHFAVQWTFCSVAIALGFALLRNRRGLVLAAALVAVWATLTWNLWWPVDAHLEAGSASLRLLTLNVYTANHDHEAVAALIEARQPDVVALLEVNERWLQGLEKIRQRYPHRVERSQSNNFGIALWSRLPLLRGELRALVLPDTPFVLAQFRDLPITLAAVHSLPPARESYASLRDRQLEAIGELRNEFRTGEFVVIGDLNTTAWSPVYRQLLERTGLVNSARGFGFQPTWPTRIPLAMIPIDHCLVSPGLWVRQHRSGPDVGSDHLPLFVELVAREAEPARLARRTGARPPG